MSSSYNETTGKKTPSGRPPPPSCQLTLKLESANTNKTTPFTYNFLQTIYRHFPAVYQEKRNSTAANMARLFSWFVLTRTSRALQSAQKGRGHCMHSKWRAAESYATGDNAELWRRAEASEKGQQAAGRDETGRLEGSARRPPPTFLTFKFPWDSGVNGQVSCIAKRSHLKTNSKLIHFMLQIWVRVSRSSLGWFTHTHNWSLNYKDLDTDSRHAESRTARRLEEEGN